MFSVASPDNRQNDRVYALRDTRKRNIATERLLRCRPTFSNSLMVLGSQRPFQSAAVLHFVNDFWHDFAGKGVLGGVLPK